MKTGGGEELDPQMQNLVSLSPHQNLSQILGMFSVPTTIQDSFPGKPACPSFLDNSEVRL